MNSFIKTIVPGLLTAVVLAIISIYLSGFGSFLSAATIALILGMVLGNSNLNFKILEGGISYTEKRILETAIVLIAFGMNVSIFLSLGYETWLFVGLSVLLVIGVALMVSKWFRLTFKMGALLGAGTAICGSAAIGAVSPLLRSSKEETGLSIGVINILSTIGLLLLPIISGLLSLSDEDSGLIIGGVIQSMGHVIGAGFTLGEDVGKAATIVKMGRVLLIIPLMLILFWVNRNNGTDGKKMSFPLFIPLFIIALILAQMPFIPDHWINFLAQVGDFLLIAAMVAIGFKIRLKPLFQIAGPSMVAGMIIFVFQVVIYLLYIFGKG